ncbi:hypothetical protein D9M72_288280 [compost metagenome]
MPSIDSAGSRRFCATWRWMRSFSASRWVWAVLRPASSMSDRRTSWISSSPAPRAAASLMWGSSR